MVATPKGTPLALLHHLKANKCLQQTVALFTITTEEVPHVDDEERFPLDSLEEGVCRAIGRYGYMESPNVTRLDDHLAVEVALRSVPYPDAAFAAAMNNAFRPAASRLRSVCRCSTRTPWAGRVETRSAKAAQSVTALCSTP